jgi:NAD+ kinase
MTGVTDGSDVPDTTEAPAATGPPHTTEVPGSNGPPDTTEAPGTTARHAEDSRVTGEPSGEWIPEIRRVAFAASPAPAAQAALTALRARYPSVDPGDADVLVALGGDGFMLQMLHEQLGTGLPVYGMHRGTVGFLMNEYREDRLVERLRAATLTTLRPLRMTVGRLDGTVVDALAINEVSLHRRTHQAAKIRVSVDGTVRLPELIADGVLVSTAAGSTAYNLSSHGPILPMGAPLLALTPVSPFRPRRWRGALLPAHAVVRFDVLEAENRPLGATADSEEVVDVLDVTIREETEIMASVLFDPDHNLDERILQEQFSF